MKSARSVFSVFMILLGLSLAQPAAAMDMQLTGKTALITGSTGGIGYGIAKVLLHEGAQVIINGRPNSLIKRFERTDEVASLVAYVASQLSSAITGAALRVDGGVVKSAF